MKSVLEIKDHGDLPPNLDDLALEGGDVLPGFSISVKQWFAEAESI